MAPGKTCFTGVSMTVTMITRIAGLFLVCLVSLCRVRVPVEIVATASALLFSVFLAGRRIC